MIHGHPCLNPTCAHVFSEDEVRGATALVCPQCGSRFQFQAGVDEPPPDATEPAAVVEWRGRGARPPSNNRKLFVVLLVASVAATALILTSWWYEVLPFAGTSRFLTLTDKEHNFTLVVPQGVWKKDIALKNALKARVALTCTDPYAWLAVLVKDYKTRKPRDAELIQEADQRLRKHFNESLELGDRVEDAEVAGQRALRLEFKGTRNSVVGHGDCYMLTYRGFAYWVLVWAAKVEDARQEWDDLATGGRGLALLDERPGWTEQPPKLITYPALVKSPPFTVQAPAGVWEEYPPDEKEMLSLLARDTSARKGVNAKNGYVIAYRLPKQPDLSAAVKAARDDLAAKMKEANEDYIVEPASATDKEGAGGTLELVRLDGREQKEYYLLAVVNEADGVLVLQCKCGWEQRQMWRLPFLDLAATLRLKQDP
jgi:hypothetical protein